MKTIITLTLITAILACACKPNTNTTMNTDRSFNGIDVSHHQGRIDWKTVAESYPNIEFVYVKGTEGTTYTDPRCAYNVREAKKNGLKVGIYHFFRMTSTPEAQLSNYKRTADILGPDLIPMIDVETGDGHSVKDVKRNLGRLLELFKKEYGVEPVIYGTMKSYNTFCAPDFNDHILYIARYGESRPVIKGPDHYNIWQYTDKATLKGIEKRVDLCRFHPSSNKEILLIPASSPLHSE